MDSTGSSHLKRESDATLLNTPPVEGYSSVQDMSTRVNQAPANPYYSGIPSGIPAPPPLINQESAARERMRRRRVNSRGGGEWAWVVLAFAMLGVVIIMGMSVSLLLRASQNAPAVMPTAEVAMLPTAVDARTDLSAVLAGGGQEVILEDGRSVMLTPWNGSSRFTLLLMGLDRRPGETGLAYRTDTMMLISLNPADNTIGILSIPRDLYVEVPGYSQLQRVNTPMVLGELRQPGLGPQLAMQTVQYNLGIRVHDYVAVDFNGFIDFIDALGGLDIEIPYPISDPAYPNMNYGYDPFYINAGWQHLDGATALKYARTRHGDNDFQRALRQQMVLNAVRDRLTDTSRLPELIVQSPSLWSALDGNMYTGLTLDQVLQLGLYLKDIPAENIRTGVINQSYTMNYTTPEGAAVLVPDRARLGPLMVEVFGASYSE
jgi:LCP family protein required for cell wall assembly